MIKIFLLVSLVLSPVRWIYVVDKGKCNGCGNCLYSCSEGAISMVGPDAYIDPELCTGCGVCVGWCPRNAIYREWYTGIEGDEVSGGNIVLSSNPVAAGLITVSGVSPETSVTVLDCMGRWIEQGSSDTSGEYSFSVSGLPRGSYLIVTGDQAAVLTVTGSGVH